MTTDPGTNEQATMSHELRATSYELNTSIANLRDLRASDLRDYDAIYLGDIYCRVYEANFLEHLEDLREGLRILADQGKRAFVATYAAPRNDFLPKVRKVLETAATAGAQAVEIHNLGIMKIAHDEFPDLPLHVGGFANIYTDAGVEVLRGFGAVRFTPNYELSLDEIREIAAACRAPMELLIHGKMPLGISDYCFLLDYEEKWGVKCPDLCQKELFLKQGTWAMKTVGKGVLSGKDVCMLEHLPRLLADGHRHFRIETVSESPAYRAQVSAVYRQALDRAAEGAVAQDEGWWETLRSHARIGMCNGFYFGKSGMDYAGIRPEADASLLTISPSEL
ncbi:MAG TPA: peptidase U32 family protein [Candidatus Methylomirabilis sp.]|nr:peptidase U32 family protein [Candidatus Methylomirabilis sp.]